MKQFISILFVVTALSLSPAGMAAEEVPAGPHIRTTGSATLEVVPDMATLQIEVSVSAKEAKTAKDKVDQRVKQYIDFLQKNGVEKKEIAAANLRTRIEYDYSKRSRQLRGYEATRKVTVKVLQLDNLNTILEGALQAELNEINQVELGVAKPERYQSEVRKKAIDSATAQAKELAEGFGAKLGSVYSIRYVAVQPVIARAPMLMSGAKAAVDGGAAKTYQQENITFRDQVDVVFDLVR